MRVMLRTVPFHQAKRAMKAFVSMSFNSLLFLRVTGSICFRGLKESLSPLDAKHTLIYHLLKIWTLL